MSKQLTVEDFRRSLTDHVASKGDEAQAKYGPRIGWTELQRILQDRSIVRYPCEIVFDAAPLQHGELACPVANSEQPEDGFKVYVHPFFALELEYVPHLVLYQLVVVNYGEFASSDDAEEFGSHALSLAKNDYYHTLCGLTDKIYEVTYDN